MLFNVETSNFLDRVRSNMLNMSRFSSRLNKLFSLSNQKTSFIGFTLIQKHPSFEPLLRFNKAIKLTNSKPHVKSGRMLGHGNAHASP